MTPDQLKQVRDEAEDRIIFIPNNSYEAGFEDGATFYEQIILSEVLKEKNEEVETANKMYVASRIANQTLYAKNQALQSQLSQLQSKMEEEKRKAFEAGVAKGYAAGANDEPITQPLNIFEEWLSSTESVNLNKQ